MAPQQASTLTIVRVVKFGIHAPSRRKQAVLEDALRRQTVAYGRALKAAYGFAVDQLKIQTQMELSHNKTKEARDALRARERAAIRAIENAAYRAAGSADCSSTMKDGLARSVVATIQSWIGWRLRFRSERPGRVKRAEERLAEVLADPAAAVEVLQARRKTAITVEHVLTSAHARLQRVRNRRPPAYPVGPRLVEATLDTGAHLAALAASTSKVAEDAARDALSAVPKIGRTPLSWSRASGDLGRGVSLIRRENGSVAAVFLPGILPSKAARGTKSSWDAPKRLFGVAEPVRMPNAFGLRLPVSFPRSAWQYLDHWSPRTAKLVWRSAGKYELHVAFAREAKVAEARSDVWVGLDRGVQHIAVAADETGKAPFVSGNRLAPIEGRLRRAREAAQKRGRAIRAAKQSYRATARNEVNRIAKHIARQVLAKGAMLAVEDLAAFATGYSPVLARAQYAALLAAVDRRLELAGRAPLKRGGSRYWEVRAAFTSITCPECGLSDKASRPDRDTFKCIRCGHQDHADVNAARNIAKRGRENKAKYEIARNRKVSGSGGGGPSSDEGEGVVSAPVSAGTGTRGIGGANSPTDDNNAGEPRSPSRARSAASSHFTNPKSVFHEIDQGLAAIWGAAAGDSGADRNSPSIAPTPDCGAAAGDSGADRDERSRCSGR